jgi:hypothetical protein
VKPLRFLPQAERELLDEAVDCAAARAARG